MLFFILFHRFTCFVCSQRMDLHVQEHHPVQTRWLLAYLLALALDHIPPTKHFRKREQKQTRFLLLLKKRRYILLTVLIYLFALFPHTHDTQIRADKPGESRFVHLPRPDS